MATVHVVCAREKRLLCHETCLAILLALHIIHDGRREPICQTLPHVRPVLNVLGVRISLALQGICWIAAKEGDDKFYDNYSMLTTEIQQ